MIVGTNMYDPYSAFGPYGRHNREYNKHELHLLLTYLGFTIDEMFTADVHDNMTDVYLDPTNSAFDRVSKTRPRPIHLRES
jgi:hypothetical protein